MPKKPKLGCRFYRTQAGLEPVREWLRSLPAELRKVIGSDILAVQFGWPMGKPLVGGFGKGLYEVRSTHDGCEYRVLFMIVAEMMLLLHGLQKKKQKTPKGDLDIARRRQKEVNS